MIDEIEDEFPDHDEVELEIDELEAEGPSDDEPLQLPPRGDVVKRDLTLARRLASGGRDALIAGLGRGFATKDDPSFKLTPEDATPLPQHGVIWQAPTNHWLFVNDDSSVKSFDLTGERVWKNEEERALAVARENSKMQVLEISEEQRLTFARKLHEASDLFFEEFLNIACLELSYEDGKQRAVETMAILLENAETQFHDKQERFTLLDLVDLRFTRTTAKILGFDPKRIEQITAARLQALQQFAKPEEPSDEQKLPKLR